MTATEGANTINVTNNATGISSAQLTLTSVTRTAGLDGQLHQHQRHAWAPSAPTRRFFITGAVRCATTQSGTTGSILGGGYTVNGTDFAAYNSTYGVGGAGRGRLRRLFPAVHQ